MLSWIERIRWGAGWSEWATGHIGRPQGHVPRARQPAPPSGGSRGFLRHGQLAIVACLGAMFLGCSSMPRTSSIRPAPSRPPSSTESAATDGLLAQETAHMAIDDQKRAEGALGNSQSARRYRDDPLLSLPRR